MSGATNRQTAAHNGDDDDKILVLKSDDNPKSIAIKQSLLVASSKYFEGCSSFNNDTVEFDSKIIPFVVLEEIVNFVENQVMKPTMDTLEHLFYATDYLQMDDAMKAVHDYLIDHLTVVDPAEIDKATLLMYLRIVNIVYRYETTTKYEYKKSSLRFISTGKVHQWLINSRFFLANYFKRIMSDKAVFKLDYAVIYNILSCNALNISETEVLMMIKMWINYDFTARKRYFPNLLLCLRFDENIKTDFILEELLCQCKLTHACPCLTSKDFVIAFMAKKNECYKNGMFKFNTFLRLRGEWKKV